MPFDHIIVEINRKPAGILACVDDEVQFFASTSAAFPLDRRTFPSIHDAMRAVAEAVGANEAR